MSYSFRNVWFIWIFLSKISWFVLCLLIASIFLYNQLGYATAVFALSFFIFLHVSYQPFNNRKAKACILWKDSACFTWFGSLELCSQWNACFCSKACPKKCLPHLLEMYTPGCCTGNLFYNALILDDVLKILYLLSPSLVLKNMLVVGLDFNFASFAANGLLTFFPVYRAV